LASGTVFAGEARDYMMLESKLPVDRRSFFRDAGAGFAGLALIDLLSRDGFFAQPGPLRGSARHHEAKA
jgi:hypothetical protein